MPSLLRRLKALLSRKTAKHTSSTSVGDIDLAGWEQGPPGSFPDAFSTMATTVSDSSLTYVSLI